MKTRRRREETTHKYGEGEFLAGFTEGSATITVERHHWAGRFSDTWEHRLSVEEAEDLRVALTTALEAYHAHKEGSKNG